MQYTVYADTAAVFIIPQKIRISRIKIKRKIITFSRPGAAGQQKNIRKIKEFNMEDFNAYDRWSKKQDRKENKNTKKKRKRINTLWKIWSVIRIPIIIVACVLIVCFVIKKVTSKLYNDYLMPVDPNDPSPIIVEIPQGSGASMIAKILYECGGEGEKGVIPHKAIFKIYVDFVGKASRLQAGTYVLSRNMSIPEIVDTLCKGMPPRETITFTVSEGLTIEAMAEKLVKAGVLESPDKFLSLCVTGEAFADKFPFIAEIPEDTTGSRPYALEGFLFPDTYEVYADADEETIIEKMLTRFNLIFGKEFKARAEKLDMTMYEVVTLASMIEKEAKSFDFLGVSAVFHNRLKKGMPLGSDASLEYILKTGSLHLTDEQLAVESPYNTHLNTGLPLGPVSNPGNAGFEAALLMPEDEAQKLLSENYLYFCLMDPESGKLIFAKTLQEHQKNVAKYSPLW